jgi:virginiamycin B lyase
MGIRKAHGYFAILFLAVVLAAATSAVTAARSPAQSATTASSYFNEYPLPAGYGAPQRITTEAPGKIWFTIPEDNAIGLLEVASPNNYQFVSHPIPTNNSNPYDLVYHDGYVWFTEQAGNKIGRLNTNTGNITEYTVPTANSGPSGIDVASDGTIWFVEKNASKVTSFNPNNQTFDETPYTRQGAQPEEISVGNNAVWFTVPNLNYTARYTPSSGEFLNVPVVDFGQSSHPPGGIAVDGSNMPWITAPTKDLIGRYAPGTLAYWAWKSVASGDHPTGISISEEGGVTNVWFVGTQGNRAGFLTATATRGILSLQEQPLPSTGSQPRDIAIDSGGTAWITAPGTGRIVEWSAPYFDYLYLPLIKTLPLSDPQ